MEIREIVVKGLGLSRHRRNASLACPLIGFAIAQHDSVMRCRGLVQKHGMQRTHQGTGSPGSSYSLGFRAWGP